MDKRTLYGLTTVGGQMRRQSHSDLVKLLANDHPQYLEENTEIYNEYATGLYDSFFCRERDSGYAIPITSIDSQDASEIVFNIQRVAVGLVDIISKSNNGIKWTKLTEAGTQVTINNGNQAIILATNTLYQDDDGVDHTNPSLSDMNSAMNKSFDRIKNVSVDVVGMVDENTITMDYTSNNILVDDDTIKLSLEKFDTAIGDRLYDSNDILTDGETITESFNAIGNFINQEYYGEERAYDGFQDFTTLSGVSVYTLTQDENATTPEVIVDTTKVLNDVDYLQVTDDDGGLIYKEGSILKISSNVVKVVSYNSATGDITLNFPPKVDFRINFKISYTLRNTPAGKILNAGTYFNVVSSESTNEADEIEYDNSTSNLSKSDVQSAIDEIQGNNPAIQFDTTLPNPTFAEGKIFYDFNKKAISYYNDKSDITVNLGQELLFSVENQTGQLIPNGSVISPSSDTIITLANAKIKDKSRIIAVTTHDIPDGETGYATKLGQIGGLDTSAFSAGTILYLSAVNAGEFTDIIPDDGAYVVTVGVVDVSDTTNGIITVDTSSTDLTVEVTDTNGFPIYQKSNTNISVVNATRTFTISPSNTMFHFYERGIKYEITGADSIIFTDVEGEHWIYYNEGILSHLENPSPAEKESIILNNAFISYFKWNAADKKVEYDIFEERHGISMSPYTHLYNHLTRGSQYISGMAVGDVLAGEDGNLDTHAQYSVTGGLFFDEDVSNITESKSVGDTIAVAYLSGTSRDFRTVEKSGFAVYGAINGRLYYNSNTAGNWGLTQVTNGDYVLYHLFAVNGVNKQLVSIMGQNQYSSLSDARAGASSEIGNISFGFELAESVPVTTFIYRTRDSYTNSVKAKIVTTDEGDDFIDWRTSELSRGTTASSHSNLTNLFLASTGVTFGHINDGLQTIYGTKTFANGLQVLSTSNTFNIETKILDTFTYSQYKSAIYDYEIMSGANMRVGRVKVLSNGVIADDNDVSDVEFGDTSPVTFDSSYVAGNVNLLVISTTTSWSIKFKKQYM